MSGHDVLSRGRQKKAFSLFAEGRLAEAGELCEKILLTDRKNTEVWNLLGEISKQTGNLDGAAAAYERAHLFRPRARGNT